MNQRGPLWQPTSPNINKHQVIARMATSSEQLALRREPSFDTLTKQANIQADQQSSSLSGGVIGMLSRFSKITPIVKDHRAALVIASVANTACQERTQQSAQGELSLLRVHQIL